MGLFDEFPADPTLLQRYTLQATQRMKSANLGEHRRRQKGMSLEFREFRDYARGDDFRHIDWRASARTGRDDRWIIRTYTAEQKLTLAISIDNRREIELPFALPKLRIGFWLAQALAMIALVAGDQVVMHRLFGAGNSVRRYRTRDPKSVREFFDRSERTLQPEDLNCAELEPFLPPASIWVLITDLYGSATQELARCVARKQRGYRSVVVVELDSWLMERQLLLHGPTRVLSPRLSDKLAIELEEAAAAGVERKIDERRDEFANIAQQGGLDYTRWVWPAQAPGNIGEWFMGKLLDDVTLMRIFRRAS